MKSLASVATAAFVLLAPALVHAEPTTVVAIDPMGLFLKRYSAGITHAVSDHVALRLDGTLYRGGFLPEHTSGQVGVTVQLFLDHAFRGPFVEAGAVYRSIGIYGLSELPDDGSPPMTTYHNEYDLAAASYVGWQWTYASRFHVAAAIGGARPVYGSQALVGAFAGNVSTESYIRAGYTW